MKVPPPPVMLLVMLSAVLAPMSSRLGAQASASAPVRLTTSGHALFPVYSPDGRKIAFINYTDATLVHGDLFVMNADGSEKTNLTTDPHGWIASQPTWSPNGKQILFAANPGDVWGGCDLFVVDADGGGAAINLTNTADNWETDPRWSPDGGRIVFSRDSRICVMDAGGGSIVELTTDADIDVPPGQHDSRDTWDEMPVWSPDGQEIAFIRGYSFEEHSHLYVMNADGSAIAMLTFDHGNDNWDPAWSPDGRALALVSAEHGSSGSIFVIDRNAGTLTKVSGDLAAVSAAVWSPSGRQITFAGVDGSSFGSLPDIYAVNADGTGLINWTGSPSVSESGSLSWSRNGRRVVFVIGTLVSESPGSWTTDTDVYVVSLRPTGAARYR